MFGPVVLACLGLERSPADCLVASFREFQRLRDALPLPEHYQPVEDPFPNCRHSARLGFLADAVRRLQRESPGATIARLRRAREPERRDPSLSPTSPVESPVVEEEQEEEQEEEEDEEEEEEDEEQEEVDRDIEPHEEAEDRDIEPDEEDEEDVEVDEGRSAWSPAHLRAAQQLTDRGSRART